MQPPPRHESNGRALSDIAASLPEALRAEKPESYLAFYEQLLGSRRHEPINVLEVGIFRGGSTLVLGEYLTQATILAIDVVAPPASLDAELEGRGLADRVQISLLSQADDEALGAALAARFGEGALDVVIDDASHTYRNTRATFVSTFGRVAPGGLYVIEDWGCGYWESWADGDPDGRHGLPRLIKELVDLTALDDRTVARGGRRSLDVAGALRSPIERLELTNGLAVLTRSSAPMPPTDLLLTQSSPLAAGSLRARARRLRRSMRRVRSVH